MTANLPPAVPGAALLPVYALMPVHPVSGHGSWLVDDQGSEWLDAYGGHAVASTGHSHPEVVQAIADQAANAMANARFLDHEVRLRQRAETLLKVAKAMRSELELPVVLQDVLDLTWQLLQAEFVGLFLSAPDRSLSLVASTELDASLQAAPWARLGPDSGLHRLLEAGHPGFETFLDLGSLWPDRPDLSRKTVPCAAVPILQQPRPSGLLLISWPEAHPPRPEDDRPLITGIAELIELSIEHQRLIQREAESHTERLLAEEVAKEREALIRQIVHDLRNSTQAISLINEEIELAAGGHPEILLGVSAIDRQITFISNFLKEKLAWMKQLHGQQRPAQTDLMPLLQRISRQFAPRFALRQQRFETPLGADQVEVPVSDVQLEQMVGNLLDNAQKYANPGATVKLWCALSDGWATLYVSDDGPGIAVDHQPRIGEIGFRGHPDVEGSGLGLANVKKLVTSNGGLFGFTSRPGVGSTFYVTLPTSRWGKA